MNATTAGGSLPRLLAARAEKAMQLLDGLLKEQMRESDELRDPLRKRLVDEALERCWPLAHARLRFRAVVATASAEPTELAFRLVYRVDAHLEEFALASAEFPEEVRFDPQYGELSVGFSVLRDRSSTTFRGEKQNAEQAAEDVCSKLNLLISGSRGEAEQKMLRRLTQVLDGFRLARVSLGPDVLVDIDFLAQEGRRPK